MSEGKPPGGSFIPKEWEGSEDLPREPIPLARLVLLILLCIAFLVICYFAFTTELGWEISGELLKGACIGVFTYFIVSR